MANAMRTGPALKAFERYLDRLTAPGKGVELPGGVAVVFDKDGIIYQYASGKQSLDPTSPLSKTPYATTTTMWIASCTKLMTAISVLQCVEKGLLDLDADITTLLPEYKDAQVITGFAADGSPQYRPAKGKITLRLLLTHQAGMGYTFMTPQLMQLAAWKSKTATKKFPKNPTLHESYFTPLIADPGTLWSYSSALDWAGLAVARATSTTLETYMRTHIWAPLKMTQTSFRLQSRPDIIANRCAMAMRKPGGELVPSPTRYQPEDSPDDGGGGGAYSCVGDYVKVLGTLLDPEGGLLGGEKLEELFAGALGGEVQAGFERTLYDSYVGNEKGEVNVVLTGGLPRSAEPTFGFGGLVTRRDVEGRRSRGSLSWGGLPGWLWMVDRKAGVGMCWGSQLLPPGDVKTAEMWGVLEEAVYADIVGKKKGARL